MITHSQLCDKLDDLSLNDIALLLSDLKKATYIPISEIPEIKMIFAHHQPNEAYNEKSQSIAQ